jgi:hypothetical protein
VLGEKLARFRNSGIADIGRKKTRDRKFGVQSVYRDMRVVWLRDLRGQKTLWYQESERNHDPGVIRIGDPGAEQFFGGGPVPFMTRGAYLKGRVPDEFAETAIAYNEQRWGSVETIDDVNRRMATRLGLDVGGEPDTKQRFDVFAPDTWREPHAPGDKIPPDQQTPDAAQATIDLFAPSTWTKAKP